MNRLMLHRQFVTVIVACTMLITAVFAMHQAYAAGDSVDEIKYSFGDTADSVIFDWRGAEQIIYYSLDTTYSQNAIARPSAITPQNGTGPFQEAVLTGLQQNSEYHYKIGMNGLDHTFQTVPASNFNWVDVGDTMGSACDLDAINNGSWMPAEHQLITAQNPAFVTHGGDIAVPNQCGLPALHQYFLDQQVWSEHAAFQPVWGDHEWEQASDAYKSAPDASNDSNSNYKGRVFMTHAQTSVADTASKTSHPGCAPAAGKQGNGCMGEDWGWFKVSGVMYISYPEVSYNSWGDWQAKADILMAQAQSDPSVDFIVTYGHRPPISDASTGGIAAAYDATQALANKYSPNNSHPNGKYVLNVGHHAHSMEAFSPINGLTYVIDAAGGQGLTNWRSSIDSRSVFRSMHFGLLSGKYNAGNHALTISMICGPDYQYQKDSCTYGNVLYSTTFQSANVTPVPVVKLTYDNNVNEVQGNQQLTYTATLQNMGTVAVSGTTIKATIPVNSSYLSSTDSIYPDANGLITWQTGTLAPGASVSKKITVQIGSLQPGSVVNSSAAVTTTDSSCQNTSSTCSATDGDAVPYPVTPLISTSVGDGVGVVAIGDTLTYITNTGNTKTGSTASGTVLSLTLPSNLTVVDAGGGIQNGNTITWAPIDIAGGQSLTQMVVTRVISGLPGSSFTVTADVQSTDCQNSGSICTATDTDSLQQPTQTVEYIDNQSVESNLTGWTGLSNSQSKARRVTGDSYDGSGCIEVSRNISSTGLTGDSSKPNWVLATVAGRKYTASVWVKGQTAGQTISLALKELGPNKSLVGSSVTTGTFWDTNWHQLTIPFTAINNGDELQFNTYNENLTAYNWFHMDQMSLTSAIN